jgi:hypothetical protein
MYPLLNRRQDRPFIDEPISVTTQSKSLSLDGVEGLFSIQLAWDTGITVDMNISLQISNDKKVWVTIPDSIVNITDASGVHMWDMVSGAQFIRIDIEVTTGSANFTCNFNGKSR